MQKMLRTPNLMFPFPGESWHLAVRIDDPDPVAVASQGSSSATLHEIQGPLRRADLK